MANKIILLGVWELTQGNSLLLHSLTVPTQWRQSAKYLANERSKVTRKYPSVPVSSLDPIVSASFPEIIKTVRKGWQQPVVPWLYALQRVDLSHLPDLIRDWLREEFTWCLGEEAVNNVLDNLNNDDWQWDDIETNLSLLEQPADINDIDFRFQAIPDYIAKKFIEENKTITFQGEDAEHELKFYPVVRLNQGAELMSYPPYEVPLIENKEHKGTVFISFVIKFSLQTVPRRKQPSIYHHLSVRRWIVEPLERGFPYKGSTAFVGDNRRWLDGTRQPFSLISLRIKEKGISARWHSAISRLMMLNDSQLPEPESIAQQPQHNWSNWDEEPEGIQIAIPYDSRHTFKHPCLPGVSPRDLASLDAAIIDKINDENNLLPLKRVGEAEEIPNKYFSYWGKKIPNDESDSSTPMHRPSLTAPAVFATRKIPLKTILIVWATKQCRDELVKEICTRLHLTPAAETRTYNTVSDGEVKETIYTGEYGSIYLKTMHVADLTQNFDIAWTEKIAEKQRKREQFMTERIERIKTYLPSTKELCGAIIEIKSPPQFDKPSKPPEADPKNSWRIGAAQANYLNQHITSRKKKKGKKYTKKDLSRVKSAVSDLFRQFGILPTPLIDPEKDGINLYTWLTCFYVLRRTRQTTVSNLPTTVVLMLRVNPVNGEVEITTPAWFQNDTKGWLSYSLAEQLLLNERWNPDSHFDETIQEDDEEQASTERKREQRLIDRFVTDCLQDCLNTPIEEEQSPHVLFMAEAQNSRKLLKWLQNPYVPETPNILPRQLNRQLSKSEKSRLSIVRFREAKQNETPVAILKDKPGSRTSGIFKWQYVCDHSEENVYLSIRKSLNTEQGLLKVSESRLDNGKKGAGNTKPIEIIIVYSSAIEQDTLAKFVHNLRDRYPYYSDFNTLPFPFSLATKTRDYAIGIRDILESEQSDEEE